MDVRLKYAIKLMAGSVVAVSFGIATFSFSAAVYECCIAYYVYRYSY